MIGRLCFVLHFSLLVACAAGVRAQTPAPSGSGSTPEEDPVKLDKLAVTAKQEALFNTIDRKVYNVGQEIQSSSGSAADLLQNIPSLQVDVDGNVRLRGNENVLILIDGKPSALMSARNRADALSQMSADAVEKVEVITNPSAKYKPDGTAGIINLTMKHRHGSGFSGSVRASVGNDRRSAAGATANYHVGKLGFFGTVNIRRDDRLRTVAESRSHLDPATNRIVITQQQTSEHMRPLSQLFEAGADYEVDHDTKAGASISFSDRTFFRTSTLRNLTQAADGSTTGDYDRFRADDEWQKTLGLTGTFEHRFSGDNHDLKLEWKRERHEEQEDNHYTNRYRIPADSPTADYTVIHPLEITTELSADYRRPLAGEAKLEAGYAGETNHNNADFRGGDFDPVSGAPLPDPARTNRFIYRDSIQALFATYGRPFGRFGLLAGLRAERARVDTEQVTLSQTARNSYTRLHPTLHLSYNLSETSQLQLNYSHRVHRPDGEDLNPFPEYQDPFNLRTGNPNLRPEETHSIETGYQDHRNTSNYLATAYYRETHNAFTTVTRYIDASTLLTTQENLASNRAGGLELAAAAEVGSRLAFNFSSNAFVSEVDAGNLGYPGTRSALAWEAKLNADWHVSPTDLIQLNTNYRARRLTAQGYRLPSFIANVGFRHEFKTRNLALTLVASDLLNSFKERTLVDTAILHDEITRRRNSRTVFIGFVYSFGQTKKKTKPETLKVDDSL